MDQKPKIINIENIRELEPAIYEATVTRADGSKSKERMSVFELQPILQQLGRPMLPS